MTTDSWIDRPSVAGEVAEALGRYEEALKRADSAALDDLFWDDRRVVRFGAGEELWGRDEIQAFNGRRKPIPDRRTEHTRITCFGDGLAVVSTLFLEVGPGRLGRQMQTWARVEGAWRVVAAHVSVVERPPNG